MSAEATVLPYVVVAHHGAIVSPGHNTPKSRFFLFSRSYFLVLIILFILAVLIFTGNTPFGKLGIFSFGSDAGTEKSAAIVQDQSAKSHHGSNTDTAAIGDHAIMALGTLLPQSELISLALPSGAGDAKILKFNKKEGDKIAAGETIAILDNEPVLLAARDAASSMVALREAELDRVRVRVQAEKTRAEAALAGSIAAATRASAEFARTVSLHERKIASASSYDNAKSEFDQATKAVEQARANLSLYSVADLEDQSEVLVARRNLELAKASLKQAEQSLNNAHIDAPIDATILEIYSHPGERPAADGIADIGNTARMMVELEVYQSDIGRVRLGDRVIISSLALPHDLAANVTFIGLKLRRQRNVGEDPATNTDARVIEVKALLDEPSSQIAARFTNLQVEGRIEVAPTDKTEPAASGKSPSEN